jgi:hypothetical protein
MTAPLASATGQRLTGGRERSSATWTRAHSQLPQPVLHPRWGCRRAARAGQVLHPPGTAAGLAGSSPQHPSAGEWGGTPGRRRARCPSERRPITTAAA